MALLERVSTLLRANLNDLIDKAEDPEKLLKQLILDMENQMMQVKTQVAIALADEHLLGKKRTEHETSEARMEAQGGTGRAQGRRRSGAGSAGAFAERAAHGGGVYAADRRSEDRGRDAEAGAAQSGAEAAGDAQPLRADDCGASAGAGGGAGAEGARSHREEGRRLAALRG